MTSLYHSYYKGCDPIKLNRIHKGDQLLPLFVVDTMSDYPGLSGLFISGIFSGSLSTVSSAINSLAAVTMEDYIKPFISVNSNHETPLLKLLALMFGLVCIFLTFIVEYLGPGILQASLTIFGVVGGPLLGIFSLGMMTTKGIYWSYAPSINSFDRFALFVNRENILILKYLFYLRLLSIKRFF